MASADIEFQDYRDESQLDYVMKLVTADLSEPYSIFTYRYFLHRFPELCILAIPKDDPDGKSEPIGCVVGKIDQEEQLMTGETRVGPTGYIGMLAVQSSYRRKGIGKALVEQVLSRMKKMGCLSVALETEVCNTSAQRLYQESFGFIREELLVRYYLNFNDAYRLRLWFEESEGDVAKDGQETASSTPIAVVEGVN
eukprot:Nitzschia sp. Nitz4//scaffold205_size38804//27532//28240//NITZ4_007648-RA/size38804-augustus-gene-0.54-mRNA-1//1//CDS//3329541525//6407//frame0